LGFLYLGLETAFLYYFFFFLAVSFRRSISEKRSDALKAVGELAVAIAGAAPYVVDPATANQVFV
jgi:hypothetical protein